MASCGDIMMCAINRYYNTCTITRKMGTWKEYSKSNSCKHLNHNCHRTTCITSRINHLHPLTITRVLITNTCNHLPPPFISSLTSVTLQLVSRLHSSEHWSMSAYLPDHPGSCPRLRKRKFTYSDTVHPASRAFLVISPMLEALPEFYWINLLLTSICLSVSLTSVVTIILSYSE